LRNAVIARLEKDTCSQKAAQRLPLLGAETASPDHLTQRAFGVFGNQKIAIRVKIEKQKAIAHFAERNARAYYETHVECFGEWRAIQDRAPTL